MKTVKSLLFLAVLMYFPLGLMAQLVFLSEDEKEDIVSLMYEEKMAKDVYVTLNKTWGNRLFTNIIQAEEQHMNTLIMLAEVYEIEIPKVILTERNGVYDKAGISRLYDQLVMEGRISENQAMMVGAKIEELDIRDLRKAIANTDNKDLLGVYQQLENAAIRHLNAFVRNLERNNISYQPVILTMEEYNNIIEKEIML